MNWRDARKEVPENSHPVLICVEGTFHLARYSKPLLAFRISDGSLFMPKYHDIQWIYLKDLPSRKKSGTGEPAGKTLEPPQAN